MFVTMGKVNSEMNLLCWPATTVQLFWHSSLAHRNMFNKQQKEINMKLNYPDIYFSSFHTAYLYLLSRVTHSVNSFPLHVYDEVSS
jgi:hypothetical protein